MVLSIVILLAWFGHLVQCYYLIRSIDRPLLRILLTLFPCIFLCYISCVDLPLFETSSIVTIAFCWLTSIRLIGLIVFLRKKSLPFRRFLYKIVWVYFPILSSKSEKNQWSITSCLIFSVVKMLINHWIYRWCLTCQSKFYYEKILWFYISLITISYTYDMEIVLVRILTNDRYTLRWFTNFPLLSLSLREFWGRRYNRLVNTVLKESIFEPISWEFSSPAIGGLTTFIVSGLFHVHIAFVIVDDTSYLFSTFLFFLLNGIACCLESKIQIHVPRYIRWLMTHIFLLMTAPLVLEPFVKKGFPFLVVHPPPYIHREWIPQLPIPNFCLS